MSPILRPLFRRLRRGKRGSTSQRLRTLIGIGLGCILLASAPISAQTPPPDYACLHIFTRDSSDLEYNVVSGTQSKVPRLPGISDRVLLSPDQQWFSLEGEVGDKPYLDETEAPYGGRQKYRAALYVSATTNGKAILPAMQIPTYVDEEVSIGSSVWSPDSKRLAYLDTVDSQGRLAIRLYDPHSGEKSSSTEPHLSVSALMLGWSADGIYVAVADYDPSNGDSLVLLNTHTLSAEIIPESLLGVESSFFAWSSFTPAFSWSPQGHDAAYARKSRDSSGSEVVVIRAVESPQVQPVRKMRADAFGRVIWSPNSRHVGVYYLKTDGFWRLQVLAVGGADDFHFESVDAYWNYWSEDGQSLLFLVGTDLKRLRLADGTIETVITGVKTWDEVTGIPYFPYNPHPNARHLIVPYTLPDGHSGVDALSLVDLSRRVLHQNAGEVQIIWSPDRAYFAGVWQASGSSEARTPSTPAMLLWASAEGEVKDLFEVSGFTYQKWFDQTTTEYGVYNLGWLDGGRKLALVTSQTNGDQVLWQVGIYHGAGKQTPIAQGLYDVSLSSADLEGDLLQFTWRDKSGRQSIDAYTFDGQSIFRYKMTLSQEEPADQLESPYYVRRSPVGGKAALISAFPTEGGRESHLYWIDGDEIRPHAMVTSPAVHGPTGLIWSPDGAYLASYEALTFALPNKFGHTTPIPDISTVEIFDSEGRLIRHLSFEWKASSLMWTRCGMLASDPYTLESLLLRNFFLPGFD